MASAVFKMACHRKELFFALLFFAIVSMLYQCYVILREFGLKDNSLPYLCCPAWLEASIEDKLVFPDLVDFNVRNNIDAGFGDFPLNKSEILKVYNFTTNTLFAFMPAMTRKEKLVSLYVFQKFINLCQRDNITFFIQGGTLLGAYRHHGFIPWDDDIDVYVNSQDKKKLFCTLKKANPNFDVHQYPKFQWKFFYTKTPTLKKYKYRWPFVDIFFYSIQGDEIFDVTSGKKKNIYKYHTVFPLGSSLFEGALLPTPCDLKHAINAAQYIRKATCHTGTYVHKLEKPRTSLITKSIPCMKLNTIYPFVSRTRKNVSEGFVKETLKLGRTVLSSVIIKSGCPKRKTISLNTKKPHKEKVNKSTVTTNS